jgi:hypothetical protein
MRRLILLLSPFLCLPATRLTRRDMLSRPLPPARGRRQPTKVVEPPLAAGSHGR